MCDTTWGGANWWMQSGTYAPNRKHNATFAVMPTLSDTRIPQAWGLYPGISLSVKESTVVTKGAELDPQSLVIGYSNIYGEDLTENLQVTVERVSGPGDIAETGRIDTAMTGDWLVTASVFDSTKLGEQDGAGCLLWKARSLSSGERTASRCCKAARRCPTRRASSKRRPATTRRS